VAAAFMEEHGRRVLGAAAWEAIAPFVDKNVFERDKGVNPDMLGHPTTGVWPVDVLPAVRGGADAQILAVGQDPALQARITKFWQWLLDEVPNASPVVSRAKQPREEAAPASRAVSTVALAVPDVVRRAMESKFQLRVTGIRRYGSDRCSLSLGDGKCPIRAAASGGGTHSRNKAYAVLRRDGTVRFKCHSDGCKPRGMLRNAHL